MFDFYNTITEYYELDENDLQNLYKDYVNFCNENDLEIFDYDNFVNFNPQAWIINNIELNESEQEESNDEVLFTELTKDKNKEEIRNRIMELKCQIKALENMLHN